MTVALQASSSILIWLGIVGMLRVNPAKWYRGRLISRPLVGLVGFAATRALRMILCAALIASLVLPKGAAMYAVADAFRPAQRWAPGFA